MSTSRHVLFVTHAYPPDGQAGVELYTQRLAKLVGARGWRATVVTARVLRGQAQNAVLEERVAGQRVLGIVQNWPRRDLPEAVLDPALDRVFAGLLDAEKPDLIAVQSLHGLSFGLLAEAGIRKIPVVWHLHDGEWSCASGGQRLHPDGTLCLPVDFSRCGACFDQFRQREGPLERWGRWVAGRLPEPLPPDLLHRGFLALPGSARHALAVWNERRGRRPPASSGGSEGRGPGARRPRELDPEGLDPRITQRRAVIAAALGTVRGVISPSRFLAQSLAADGVPIPPVRVVPSGVRPGVPRPPYDGPLRVGFVGTFVAHKGPQVLAAALSRMGVNEAGRIDAWAAGPAPHPAFQDEVRLLGGRRLPILPAMPPAEVPGALAGLDVLVAPAIWAENAPLIVLEARAAGCVVVASDLGGLPELVRHEVDGLLVRAGDADALSEALVRLASDPLLFTALARGVRANPPATEDAWADAIVSAWDAP